MRMTSPIRAAGVLVLLLCVSACGTTPRQPAGDGAAQGDIPPVKKLFKTAPREGRGVALAGGGTKAASYGMGVLAAIADEKLYGGIDAISTVSGGGYAAFFLYSKVLVRGKDPASPQIADFFEDCLPDYYEAVLPASAQAGRCANAHAGEGDLRRFRFQQFVRCRQDVLENDCTHHREREDRSNWLSTPVLVAATGLAVLPNFVARTVFDWPVNLSPTRHAYMQGIGTAYGLYPLGRHAAQESPDLIHACDESRFLNCDGRSGAAWLDARGLRFTDLQAHMDNAGAEKVPTWIINATASRSRSLFGWAREGRRDFTRYTMQMSPYMARSGHFGRVPLYADYLDLLEATTAAAAFLDSNQIAIGQPSRMALALAQHAAAADWGVDIPNPNVHRGWRALHVALPLWPWPWTKVGSIPNLPFPTYLADGTLRELGDAANGQAGRRPNNDSAYIRLLDGGNNDDLGAYTLIEAGFRHVVIADHAQDRDGDMGDLCKLHNEVFLRSGGRRQLLVPGLKDFASFCVKDLAESECAGGACAAGASGAQPLPEPGAGVKKRGYPIHAWTHPVLLGCVQAVTLPGSPATPACASGVDTRIYVLKPAMNLDAFTGNYIASGKVLERAADGTFGACHPASDGPCEVAAYLATLPPPGTDRKGQPRPIAFPQHTTVGMTFASDSQTYGAYRELARWQARKALRMLDLDDAGFLAAVSAQAGEAAIALREIPE